MAAMNPAGTTTTPPMTTGGKAEICSSRSELRHPALQAVLKIVGAAARPPLS